MGCDTWTRAGQNCYMFNKGHLLGWQDARAKCQSIQGDLANIKTLDMQVFSALFIGFFVTVKAAPHECVISTGLPQT